MIKRIVGGIGLAALLSAGAAQAHPKVVSSTPAANAHVMEPVKEIRITFSEEVAPKLSSVVLKTTAGQLVKTGAASIDPKDKKQLIVPIQTGAKLPEGWYTVEWTTVGGDAHKVQGSYTFMSM